MKKITKISVLTALCVLVLAIGLLAGCGNKNSKTEDTAPDSTVENTVPEEAEATDDEALNKEDEAANDNPEAEDSLDAENEDAGADAGADTENGDDSADNANTDNEPSGDTEKTAE